MSLETALLDVWILDRYASSAVVWCILRNCFETDIKDMIFHDAQMF